MFEQQDPRFWKGKKLNFQDTGQLVKGAKSRKFAVYSRRSGLLLGYIKWLNFQYLMYPLNTFLDKFELREIAEFCEQRTDEHMQRSYDKQAVKRKEYKGKRHIPGPVPRALLLRLEQETVAEPDNPLVEG